MMVDDVLIKTFETRRDNLRAVVTARGGPTAVAGELGFANASYLSQLVGPAPSRTISERAARSFEQTLGLPLGYLDMVRG